MGSRSRKRRRAAGAAAARPAAPREADGGTTAEPGDDRLVEDGATAEPGATDRAAGSAHAVALTKSTATTAAAAATLRTRPPAPIGARTRSGAATTGAPDPIANRYARGRARDESIRASLEPLEPGERPRVLTLAAIVAFAFAVANSAAALSGNDIASPSGDPTSLSLVTTALLVVAGIGMLARQYWAVLGFQTILGIQIVFFSLYLIGVQKLWQAIIPLVAMGLLGWLFWKLVRAMARLQMPDRGPGQQGR